MDLLVNKSCEEFTELLASPLPVPGGGGASALVGALAIALGDMVGELTIGKKKYAAVEEEIREWMRKAQMLRKELLECVDADAAAFEPLSKAYAIDKSDPTRREVMERCLYSAAEVPLKIFDLSCEGLDLLKKFGEKGSKLMISDAACGSAMAKAAMLSAAVNVRINTRLMEDRETAEEMNAHIESKLAEYSLLADEIYGDIYEQLDREKGNQVIQNG